MLPFTDSPLGKPAGVRQNLTLRSSTPQSGEPRSSPRRHSLPSTHVQRTQEGWTLNPVQQSAWSQNPEASKSGRFAVDVSGVASRRRSDTDLRARSKGTHKAAESEVSDVSFQSVVNVAKMCADIAAWQAKSLLHPDVLERRRALILITCLGGFVSPFTEKLITLLEDDDPEVSKWAATALDCVEALPAAEALKAITQFRLVEPKVLLKAANILRRRAVTIDKVNSFTDGMSRSMSEPQLPNVKMQSSVRSSSKRVDATKLEEQKKAETLSASAVRLLRYGTRTQRIKTLQSVRDLDFAALIHPPWHLAESCVELLRAEVNQAITTDDGLVSVSMEAAITLGTMGKAALKYIASRLEDADSEVRRGAILALKFVGPAASGKCPLIAARLTDPVYEIRGEAAKALSAFGPEAVEKYKMAIDSISGDGEGKMREVAEVALSRGLHARGTWRNLAVTDETQDLDAEMRKRNLLRTSVSILRRMPRGQR